MMEKDSLSQPTNFKFCLGKNVKTKDGRAGKVCSLIAKDYKLKYNVIFERNVLECNLSEFELETI